jgi:EAL domain-containing protein (putative c-di-GMP-specific phosphodiesterase class I)
MICIMTLNHQLTAELTETMLQSGLKYLILDPAHPESVKELYSEGVRGIVVDELVSVLPEQAWLDLLGSLGRRIPIFMLGNRKSVDATNMASRNAELLTYIENATAPVVFSLLIASGAANFSSTGIEFTSIPNFNIQVPLHILKGSGTISMISINALSFRKIAIDYGVEAYQKLQTTFQMILNRMWGSPGCFRRNDMMMRKSTHSNTFYVFLEQSRQSHTVPAPGVLENMADRIALRLQKEMWAEVLKNGEDRNLPDCITMSPDFSVGYSTALYNPCVDVYETVEHLIEGSSDVAKVQVRRIKDRACELMHTLIQTKDLLYPNYQAVFKLQGLTKELVESAKNEKSIRPLKSLLYGFESLVRARSQLVQDTLSGDHLFHLDARLLRADILFALAHQSKVALELDQVCLGLGIRDAVTLPGRLMVNILPRNLLHLERLTHLLSPRSDIVFEISESEGVSNPKLMSKVRDYISTLGCSIAADDFGKGYASIERVIKLKPEIIKLDRSLVDGIHKDAAKKMFVEGIVRAAKEVSALILAEGVEEWEEAEVVQSLGIDLIQGFLCHRPQSLEEITSQLAEPDVEESAEGLDRVA